MRNVQRCGTDEYILSAKEMYLKRMGGAEERTQGRKNRGRVKKRSAREKKTSRIRNRNSSPLKGLHWGKTGV